ncbi:hypothetical protein KSF_108170 [Reticulibacter mediterranei]|uniref:Uncharacterized protein n=2 Tax=Reticulibacter mediterranei TaxID=2778369 RepID=A0A8J3IRM4_9CHLR|nr:hypothetical protein KSF_108170 [Reticulibacter mediterranei]
MSLLQLGNLAIRHGWKVVLLDPQTNRYQANLFEAAMRSSGCKQVYQLASGQSHRLPPPRAMHAFLEDVFAQEETVALSIGVNIWSQPAAARLEARKLLRYVTRAISEREPDEPRLLLLLKHPELLLAHEELPPLFALLDQAQGSLFAAARSVADFAGVGEDIVEQVSTLIMHRGSPMSDVPIRHCFKQQVFTMPDDECIVLHAGRAAHVRVNPVELDLPSLLVKPILPLPPECPEEDEQESDLDDLEEMLAEVFGPGASHTEETSAPQSSSTHHVVTLSVGGNTDQAFLRSAFSLLGRFGS